ncbi:MAG: hypothetical protein ACI31M_04240 [Bacilli bacterium]
MTTEEIKEFTKDIDYTKNFLKDYNGLLLTPDQVETLTRYGISIEECGSMTELLYIIDEVLDNEEAPELEWIADTLQERNYYENTNK